MKKTRFLFVVLVSLTSLLNAQNPQWIIYNMSNSGLTDDYVNSIAFDGNGSKWIGTYQGGLAVYNQNGIPSSINDKRILKNQVTIYPNPASDYFNIKLL